MDKEVSLKIPVNFEKISEYQVADSRFIKCKIFLMHTLENLNGSYFSKEVIEKAIPTLANTPILGYIEENKNGEEDFSDHRIELERKDKEIKVSYKGKAVGVIPETNNAHFEMRLCEDNVEREFLVVYGILWSKFDDSIDIFRRDTNKQQSMELDENYKGHYNENNYFSFDFFKFYGACVLGDDVSPAMRSASIDTNFAMNEIQVKLEQFTNYMNNQSSNEVDIDKLGKEDEILTDKIEETTEEIIEAVEDVVEVVVDTVEEEVIETPDVVEVVEETEFTEKIEDEIITEENLQITFSSTYQQKRDSLQNALQGSESKDEEGKLIQETRYWVADFDDTFVYVEKNVWSVGDYNCEKGRFGYVFDSSALISEINGEFEPMIVSWLTVEENDKLQKSRDTFELIQTENVELKLFKETAVKEKFELKVAQIFSKFEKQLNNVAEFESFKENYNGLEVEVIEEKLFALLGKKNANFSVKPKETVVKLAFESQEDEEETDPYGGILARKYNK